MELSIKNLVHIFFPERCVICERQLLKSEKTLCVVCRHELPLTGFTNESDNEMERSFTGRSRILAATALLYFYKKGSVQTLIHELKYRGHQEIGTFLGKWLGEEIRSSKRFKVPEMIVPVPLHPKKLKKRTYNQVAEFGKSLSETLNIPFVESVLKRNIYTETQTYKHRIDRFQNTKNIFEVNDLRTCQGKHILLIDDVQTTGATLEACCNELQKIPGIKISIATMAYTP
ncbi:MAG: ComF family protein [Flavobacteriia bacterium]|nr:MAG: ComF family protein [Flavobacteriia bacterium]